MLREEDFDGPIGLGMIRQNNAQRRLDDPHPCDTSNGLTVSLVLMALAIVFYARLRSGGRHLDSFIDNAAAPK